MHNVTIIPATKNIHTKQPANAHVKRRVAGYARVSTKGQQRDGNSLDEQWEKLKNYGCDEIIQEAYTGTKMDRPKMLELLNRLQPGDELVVCKLDRFARTAAEGSTIIKDLVDRGIVVNVLNMGKADNTPMGKLMVTIMLAFAEYERDMIVERTQSGKEIARQKEGFKEGRPALDIDITEMRCRVTGGEITVTAACKELGISRSSWYRLVG